MKKHIYTIAKTSWKQCQNGFIQWPNFNNGNFGQNNQQIILLSLIIGKPYQQILAGRGAHLDKNRKYLILKYEQFTLLTCTTSSLISRSWPSNSVWATMKSKDLTKHCMQMTMSLWKGASAASSGESF